MSRSTPLVRERSPELVAALDAGWEAGLASGLVVYDPAGPDVETVLQPPYRYHYLPARAARPGARKHTPPPAAGLRLPHAACPFDEPDFVGRRELARVRRGVRTYHLVANRYPVTPRHILPVRSADADPGRLPQHLHGPAEIEDLLLLLVMTGPPYHVYFNSNRGADNSQSGSSVNHWHGQLFPLAVDFPSAFYDEEPELSDAGETVMRGRVASWPARHVLLQAPAGAVAALARALWLDVEELNAQNVAYNLDAMHHRGRLRAALFPRHPGAEIVIPGAGVLDPNFGGWELTGEIVIPTREILEWIRRHPREAHEMTTRRLRETTRAG
jgi:hypothetical protein